MSNVSRTARTLDSAPSVICLKFTSHCKTVEIRTGLTYCAGALSTGQSGGAPSGVGSGSGAVVKWCPSIRKNQYGWARRIFFPKPMLKSRIFGIFASCNGLLCGGVKEGLELKYETKITSIIWSDEILNWPHVCSQPPMVHPICLLSIWAKRKCTFWCFAA